VARAEWFADARPRGGSTHDGALPFGRGYVGGEGREGTMGNSDHGTTYMRVGRDDGELRPWHYIYVYSIESRLVPGVARAEWFADARPRGGSTHDIGRETGRV